MRVPRGLPVIICSLVALERQVIPKHVPNCFTLPLSLIYEAMLLLAGVATSAQTAPPS